MREQCKHPLIAVLCLLLIIAFLWQPWFGWVRMVTDTYQGIKGIAVLKEDYWYFVASYLLLLITIVYYWWKAVPSMQVIKVYQWKTVVMGILLFYGSQKVMAFPRGGMGGIHLKYSYWIWVGAHLIWFFWVINLKHHPTPRSSHSNLLDDTLTS